MIDNRFGEWKIRINFASKKEVGYNTHNHVGNNICLLVLFKVQRFVLTELEKCKVTENK